MFYLGTHMPNWLATAGVPLFVSRRRLATRPARKPATTRWALDSGGFTELHMHGAYTFTASEYAEEILRWADAIGVPDWVAPMDMMCEPSVLAMTGGTVYDHQQQTIENYYALQGLVPAVTVIPVLQGWRVDDYQHHAEQWEAAGVDLPSVDTVGVGSICRRGQDTQIGRILRTLYDGGLTNLHAFGVRGNALRQQSRILKSADSMAWSYAARKRDPLPGCSHQSCANCLKYALQWRELLLASIDDDPLQMELFP